MKNVPILQSTRHLPRKQTKPKREFSKILTAIVLAVGILNLLAYHVAVFYAISRGSMILPDASLGTQTVITILGGLLSYCLYQFGLKNSRNKYGIDEEGHPYKTCDDINDAPDDFNGEEL